MLNVLRRHGKKIVTGLLLTAAMGVGGAQAYQRYASCSDPACPCNHGGVAAR
jgi:hypothetical protein